MPITYRDSQFYEPPRARVVITAVSPQNGTATGITRGGQNQYIIDLSVAVGPIWHVPAVGEEWIITRAANAWALERLGNLQSQGYVTFTSQPQGTSVVNKDLTVTGRLTASQGIVGGGFRHVGATAPSTDGWQENDFWYDTSTEGSGAGTIRRWTGTAFIPAP